MSNSNVSLVLLGEPRNLEAEFLDPVTSPYTSKSLRRLRLELRVRGDADHERLMAELAPATSGEALISGVEGDQWKVTNRSYSYQDGAAVTVFSHMIELEEHEQLTLDRVRFRGLTLTPERWSLGSGSEKNISLTALVSLNASEHEQLERVMKDWQTNPQESPYFPVLWDGVSDEPVSMRFGKCLWQSTEDGGARHLLVLVTEQGDEDQPFLLFEPEKTRLIEQSVIVKSTLNALIEELERAGTLDGQAIGRVRAKTGHLEWSMMREFDRVGDVEAFFS